MCFIHCARPLCVPLDCAQYASSQRQRQRLQRGSSANMLRPHQRCSRCSTMCLPTLSPSSSPTCKYPCLCARTPLVLLTGHHPTQAGSANTRTRWHSHKVMGLRALDITKVTRAVLLLGGTVARMRRHTSTGCSANTTMKLTRNSSAEDVCLSLNQLQTKQISTAWNTVGLG